MKELNFGKDFIFGAASSAFQMEGAWNEDGKGESIWDRHCHDGMGKVDNNDVADVAIDHYHRLDEDLDILKELGLRMYRFSIAWTRILPDGIGRVNQKGIDFYNRLIDGLIARGIMPAPTLFHWDYPIALQNKGGWANRESVDWFVEYAKVCFENFGDRVPYWITLNEAMVFTFGGYEQGHFPPCVRDYKTAVQTAHHALLAHGAAIRKYREMGFKGKFGIALDIVPKVPVSSSEEDRRAAQIANDTTHYYFYNAVVKGEYPQEALKLYEKKGYMPQILPGDMDIIGTKCDFIGVNYYYTQAVAYRKGAGRFDYEVVSRGLPRTDIGWEIDPEGLYNFLKKANADTNGKMPILITENGRCVNDMPVLSGEIIDTPRIDYLQRHLAEVKRAKDEGVDLRGYLVWTPFDNFEWGYGYSKRFGLVYVDYSNLKRTIKKSGYWYRDFIHSQK